VYTDLFTNVLNLISRVYLCHIRGMVKRRVHTSTIKDAPRLFYVSVMMTADRYIDTDKGIVASCIAI